MSFVFFDRAVELRVGLPGNPQGTVMGLGRSWTDLKVEFEVSRTLGSKPNTAKVKLFNPSEWSTGTLIVPGSMVQILAGYKPLPSLLFTGNVARRGVTVEKSGTDLVVSLEAGDGELSYATSRFDWHYAAGTDVNLILSNLLAAMGLGLGAGSPTLPPRVLANDVTFFGKATAVLDELCRDGGATWSIQDGNLVLLLGDAPTTDLAVSLDATSGLLGTPSRTDDGGVNFQSLLHPGIRPGVPVFVGSLRGYNGFVKPKVVKHTGDTHGGNWQTEVEAVPLL